MKKQYLVILGVIGLFITITGASFAYFMLNNSLNELETDVTAALLASVEFEGGQEVVIPEHGIYPGWIGVQTFHVNKPDGYTSGTGSYQIQMETTIAAEFQDWITIVLYKTTTPDTNNIVRTEGDIVSSPDNSLEIFASDSVKYNNFIEDTDCILKDELDYVTPKYVIDSNTGTITIEVEDFNISTMEDTTYYVVYRFTNEDENQNGAQGADFKTKIVINNGMNIKPYNPNYKDEILAGSDPVLDSKMIPVVISDTGVVTVANLEQEWYNYTNSEWANAVILNTHRETTPGEVLDIETDIAQMYVWIPRYEYSKSSIESAAHAIDVTFVDVNTTITTAEMESEDIIVHPAFCFGNECQEDRSHADNIELPGLWVGKFELGWQDGFVHNDLSPWNNDVETTYIIKPNVNSVHKTNVSTMFYNIQRTNTTYSLDAITDVHMMKNTEWGLTAYLSQSKYGICNNDGTCTNSEGANIKIENNNYYKYSTYDIVTGCGGDDTSQGVSLTGVAICPETNRWETPNGVKASTTHNITGIYDMAGGRNEYVMGNMKDSSGNFYPSYSGTFTNLESKYYDVYENGSSSIDYIRGIWGDATEELKPGGDSTPTNLTMENWNSDYAYFVRSPDSWFLRGVYASAGSGAGVWSIFCYSGHVGDVSSARAVLAVAQ